MGNQLAAIREDFLLWCAHMGIRLFDWQKEDFGEATRRENGRFVHRLVGISVPRGDGKSERGSRVGAWGVTRSKGALVLSTALTLDGAKVVLNHGRRFFRDRSSAEVLTNEIRIPSIDSRWMIASREHTSSRGLHPDIVIYDEVGWANDDELFSSLLAAQASVDDPLMIVISTVGRRRAGPLWTIKTLAEAEEPGVLWRYSTENRSPKVTKAFLDRQHKILMPAQFAREHQNQWVDSADSFCSVGDVDAAMGHGWTEQLSGRPDTDYEYFVDLGAIHDPTVIAIGHREGSLVYIDRLITFQGSREAPVQLPVVAQKVQELTVPFHPNRIRIESWQGLMAVQILNGLGLPVEVFAPIAKAHADEWPVLAQHLTGRTLILPSHPKLREELLNLSYEVRPHGVKVSDKGTIHQDHAVAVRGVVAALSRKSRAIVRSGGYADPHEGKSAEQIQAETDAEYAEKATQSAQAISEDVKRVGFWGFLSW